MKVNSFSSILLWISMVLNLCTEADSDNTTPKDNCTVIARVKYPRKQPIIYGVGIIYH